MSLKPVSVINIEELSPETRSKLGIKTPPHDSPVEIRTLGLGKVLQSLSGLTNREALWVLHHAEWLIRTGRGRKKSPLKGGNYA